MHARDQTGKSISGTIFEAEIPEIKKKKFCSTLIAAFGTETDKMNQE